MSQGKLQKGQTSIVLQKTLLIVNPRRLEWVLNLKTVNCQNIAVVVVLSQEVNSIPPMPKNV